MSAEIENYRHFENVAKVACTSAQNCLVTNSITSKSIIADDCTHNQVFNQTHQIYQKFENCRDFGSMTILPSDITSSMDVSKTDREAISQILEYLDKYKEFRSKHEYKHSNLQYEEMIKQQIKKPLENAIYDNLVLQSKLERRDDYIQYLRRQRILALSANSKAIDHKTLKNQENVSLYADRISFEYAIDENKNIDEMVQTLGDKNAQYSKEISEQQQELARLQKNIKTLNNKLEEQHLSYLQSENINREKIRSLERRLSSFQEMVQSKYETISSLNIKISYLTVEISEAVANKCRAEELADAYNSDKVKLLNTIHELEREKKERQDELLQFEKSLAEVKGQALTTSEKLADVSKRYSRLVEELDEIVMLTGYKHEHISAGADISLTPSISSSLQSQDSVLKNKQHLKRAKSNPFKERKVAEDKLVHEKTRADSLSLLNMQLTAENHILSARVKETYDEVERLRTIAFEADNKSKQIKFDADKEVTRLVSQNAELLVELEEETAKYKALCTKSVRLEEFDEECKTLEDCDVLYLMLKSNLENLQRGERSDLKLAEGLAAAMKALEVAGFISRHNQSYDCEICDVNTEESLQPVSSETTNDPYSASHNIFYDLEDFLEYHKGITKRTVFHRVSSNLSTIDEGIEDSEEFSTLEYRNQLNNKNEAYSEEGQTEFSTHDGKHVKAMEHRNDIAQRQNDAFVLMLKNSIGKIIKSFTTAEMVPNPQADVLHDSVLTEFNVAKRDSSQKLIESNSSENGIEESALVRSIQLLIDDLLESRYAITEDTRESLKDNAVADAVSYLLEEFVNVLKTLAMNLKVNDLKKTNETARTHSENNASEPGACGVTSHTSSASIIIKDEGNSLCFNKQPQSSVVDDSLAYELSLSQGGITDSCPSLIMPELADSNQDSNINRENKQSINTSNANNNEADSCGVVHWQAMDSHQYHYIARKKYDYKKRAAIITQRDFLSSCEERFVPHPPDISAPSNPKVYRRAAIQRESLPAADIFAERIESKDWTSLWEEHQSTSANNPACDEESSSKRCERLRKRIDIVSERELRVAMAEESVKIAKRLLALGANTSIKDEKSTMSTLKYKFKCLKQPTAMCSDLSVAGRVAKNLKVKEKVTGALLSS